MIEEIMASSTVVYYTYLRKGTAVGAKFKYLLTL